MKFMIRLMLTFFLIITTTVAYSGELEFRNGIEYEVKKNFFKRDFDRLDEIANQYRESQERTDSGLWKLTIFYYGFNKFLGSRIKDEEYWARVKGIVNEWVVLKPKSPAAHIVKGIVLKGYAWKFRGGSWAKDVPAEAWKPFKDNLAVAHEYMLENKSIASSDPHWYEVTANIKNTLGEEITSYRKLVNEGLDRFPEYYQLYFSAINYYAPKWHGSKQEIENFADEAVARISDSEGMGLYARIYWYASQTQYNTRLFQESDVVWSKMKEGIYIVVKQYPDSWNIQNFAFFSCMARDRDMTKYLFDMMTEPMIKRAWKKQKYYDYCKEFAYQS